MRLGWKWSNIYNREKIKLTSENMVSNTEYMTNSAFFTWGFTKCDSEKWTHIEMLITLDSSVSRSILPLFMLIIGHSVRKSIVLNIWLAFVLLKSLINYSLKMVINWSFDCIVFFSLERSKNTHFFVLAVWLLIKHVKTQLSSVWFLTQDKKSVWFDIIPYGQSYLWILMVSKYGLT